MIKMNKWLLLGFSVLLFSTLAQGLVCNVCHFKLGKLCFRSGSPCRVSEGQLCETTTVYSGQLQLYQKFGCSKYAELCNKTEKRDNALGMRYIRSCCNFDLCNG